MEINLVKPRVWVLKKDYLMLKQAYSPISLNLSNGYKAENSLKDLLLGLKR